MQINENQDIKVSSKAVDMPQSQRFIIDCIDFFFFFYTPEILRVSTRFDYPAEPVGYHTEPPNDSALCSPPEETPRGHFTLHSCCTACFCVCPGV